MKSSQKEYIELKRKNQLRLTYTIVAVIVILILSLIFLVFKSSNSTSTSTVVVPTSNADEATIRIGNKPVKTTATSQEDVAQPKVSVINQQPQKQATQSEVNTVKPITNLPKGNVNPIYELKPLIDIQDETNQGEQTPLANDKIRQINSKTELEQNSPVSKTTPPLVNPIATEKKPLVVEPIQIQKQENPPRSTGSVSLPEENKTSIPNSLPKNENKSITLSNSASSIPSNVNNQPKVNTKPAISTTNKPVTTAQVKPQTVPTKTPVTKVPTETKKSTSASKSTSSNAISATMQKPNNNKSTTRSANNEIMTVQIVSLTDPIQAEAYRVKLKNKGFPARVESFSNNGQAYYRVRVGVYTNRQEAVNMVSKLHNSGFSAQISR